MSFTTWIDGRIKVAVDEAANVLDAKLDAKFGDMEANVGAMFNTVSGDVGKVSAAVEKSTVDTITAVGQAIAGLPQQFLSMLPKLPFT